MHIYVSKLSQNWFRWWLVAKPSSEPMLAYYELDPYEQNFNEIWNKIHQFSYKKMNLFVSKSMFQTSVILRDYCGRAKRSRVFSPLAWHSNLSFCTYQIEHIPKCTQNDRSQSYVPMCCGLSPLKCMTIKAKHSKTIPCFAWLYEMYVVGYWNRKIITPAALSLMRMCLSSILSPSISFWPSDAIWRQRSGSALTQVMACCLTAPSHYLNQCWLIISEVQWHSY